MSARFKDHFSESGNSYRQFRPGYPPELFAWLASLTTNRIVWDCATGSGQAALGLAEHFSTVVATDASFNQLRHTIFHRRIEYLCCKAETSCFRDGSIDLITVGQAMHWFDFDAFFRQASKVLRSDGILAFWCYGLGRITPEIDKTVNYFYHSVVGPFWPPERKYIETGYGNITMPMEGVEVPSFAMHAFWNLHQFLGYLATWSAVRRFEKANETDPLEAIREQLLSAWGEPEQRRKVCWPLYVKVGRNKT